MLIYIYARDIWMDLSIGLRTHIEHDQTEYSSHKKARGYTLESRTFRVSLYAIAFFQKVRYIEILVIYQKVPTYTSIYPRLYPCSDCFQAKVFIRSKLWQTYFQSFAIVTWTNLTRRVQQVNKC